MTKSRINIAPTVVVSPHQDVEEQVAIVLAAGSADNLARRPWRGNRASFLGILRPTALAAILWGLIWAPSATAQILTGLEFVEGEVPSSVTFSKEIQLDCPPGKVAVSGGGVVTGPATQGQTLYQSLPIYDPPTSWVVVGRDVDGGGTDWGLRARVWCADPPPGLEKVSALSDMTSFSPKALSVECPTGKATIGGGVAIASNTATTVGINEITVLPSENWTFGAIELVPDGADWGLLATVLCADVEPSLRFRSVDRALSEFMSIDMYCPDGTFALAGGGEVFPFEAALTGNLPGMTYAPYWYVAASQPGMSGAVYSLDLTLLCHPTTLLFGDDFESGTTGAWSFVVP